ncbi:hypothetical protein BN946_scf184842.g18 [Trametes cinnabarina]|uniref:Uncharacterized protein n=1 Tax=Pycnoporus cinnabarinus TaxID=5643 RepID=A0A060S1T6_PYCCI|nr:hypothetical protein BN946_scf184842.g18 [Trametes cinnabarina]
MRSPPAFLWSANGGSPGTTIDDLCSGVERFPPRKQAVPPFLRRVFRSVSNLSLRSPTLDGARSPKLPSPGSLGAPYHKTWRPTFYTPALRQPRALPIPEDFSLKLLSALTRAEERMKAKSSGACAGLIDDPTSNYGASQDDEPVEVLDSLSTNVDSARAEEDVLGSEGVSSSIEHDSSSARRIKVQLYTIGLDTVLVDPEATGAWDSPMSNATTVEESASESEVSNMVIQEEDGIPESGNRMSMSDIDPFLEGTEWRSIEGSAARVVPSMLSLTSSLSHVHSTELDADVVKPPSGDAQLAPPAVERSTSVAQDCCSLTHETLPTTAETIIRLPSPSISRHSESPGQNDTSSTVPGSEAARNADPAISPGPLRPTVDDNATINPSSNLIEDRKVTPWPAFPFYVDEFPPIELPSLPAELDAVLLAASASSDSVEFAEEIYLVQMPITPLMLFTVELTYDTGAASCGPGFPLSYPCCSSDPRGADVLPGGSQWEASAHWDSLSTGMVCVAVVGSVVLLYVAFSAC